MNFKRINSKEQKDQDKRLAVAKALINSTKYEDNNIYDSVDQRAISIVVDLDKERREEYLDYRGKIKHERFIGRERKRRIKQPEEEGETEDDWHYSRK